jgi:hypothetical protein
MLSWGVRLECTRSNISRSLDLHVHIHVDNMPCFQGLPFLTAMPNTSRFEEDAVLDRVRGRERGRCAAALVNA